MLLTYGAFALGALCMLLGFFTVARGVGAGDSQTTFKMFGIEFSASKLGPGLVFSLLGLILVLVAVFVQPKLDTGQPAASANAAAPSSPPQADPSPRPAEPAAPAAAAAPVEDTPRTEARGETMSHQEVAALVRDTLTRMAMGECPQDNLDAMTYAQCSQGLPILQRNLVMAGPIRGVSYFGALTTPAGTFDQYTVVFQNVTAIWKTRVYDHRLAAIWTGPPP